MGASWAPRISRLQGLFTWGRYFFSNRIVNYSVEIEMERGVIDHALHFCGFEIFTEKLYDTFLEEMEPRHFDPSIAEIL